MVRFLAYACLAFVAVFCGTGFSKPGADSVTHYPVPHGAIIVAADGSDAGVGSPEAPLRSIGHAISLARPGATIVVRDGVYREALPTISKRIILQPYPGETPVVKGSLLVADWTRQGDVWVHEGWQSRLCQTCAAPGILDLSANPEAGLPEQVFVEGLPLRQVARQADVGPGRFFVDRDKARLVLGTNPTGRTVEVTVHERALTFVRGAEGSILRGLSFAHFGPPAQDGRSGMVTGDARDLTIEHNTFAFSAAVGLNIFAPNARVRHNTFRLNGLAGLGAWRADGLELSGNLFAANNSERFAMAGDLAAAAGAKITQSREVSISENRFEDNHAIGLWLDINVTGAAILYNWALRNTLDGIYYEISSDALIASNVAARNGRAGLVVSGSEQVQILHNTLAANAVALMVIDDARLNPDRTTGPSWITAQVTFENNLVWLHEPTAIAWMVRDYSETTDAIHMLTAAAHNLYVWDEPHAVFADWWRGNQRTLFADLHDAQRATGLGAGSHKTQAAADHVFRNPRADDFRLRPETEIPAMSSPLGPEVRAMLGLPANARPLPGAIAP